MIVSVIDAKYLDNFKIDITLNLLESNSDKIVEKVVDLKDYISSKKNSGIFAPLKNRDYFKNFTLNSNTLEWPNGADIAPERFLEL